MALTRIVGDIHGGFNEYSFYTLGVGRTRSMGQPVPPDRSIQVGDFGIGFYSSYWHEAVNDWMKVHTGHRFIRGNHDSPAMCKTMAGYIEDGKIEGDIMYVGGAWSIDHAMRTESVDWWRDEEISIYRFNEIIADYIKAKPRVMITHDCPTEIAWEMFISKGLSLAGSHQIKTRTGEALQQMWELHQPELWFFGHWHQTKRFESKGTTFMCLGEQDYVDVDI